MTPNEPSLGMGVYGTRAQNRTRNTRRPLSQRFPSIEATLGYLTPMRQPQNLQPTQVHVPTAQTPEPELLYPPLPMDQPQDRRPSDVPQRQQGTLPTPVPERQNEPINPRRQRQNPQPADVHGSTTRIQAPQSLRSRTDQLQVRRPLNGPGVVLREGRQQDPPPAPVPERQNPYRRFARYLRNAAPSIHATRAVVNVAGDLTLTIWTEAETLSKYILKGLWGFIKNLPAQITISKLSVIVVLLAGYYRQQLVGAYVCPSVNSFCDYQYNPLSPLVCPVEMCISYPSSTAAAILSMESTPTLYNRIEQEQHIRTLFRIPESMHWSAAG